MKKLIYVMNPMCGWCFGNSKSFEALYDNFKNKIDIEVCLGAMWLKNEAPSGSAALKDFVVKDAVHLKSITKQSPSEAFFDLAGDTSYQFDSFFPASAIMAVQTLDNKQCVPFIQMVQKRLFIEGIKLNTIDAYADILKELSIDVHAFEKLWLSAENSDALNVQFSQAQSLANSYPTLLLKDDAHSKIVSRGYFDYTAIEKKLTDLIH